MLRLQAKAVLCALLATRTIQCTRRMTEHRLGRRRTCAHIDVELAHEAGVIVVLEHLHARHGMTHGAVHMHDLALCTLSLVT